MRTRRDLKLLSKAELELDLLDSERDIDRLKRRVRDLENERRKRVRLALDDLVTAQEAEDAL